MKNALLICCTLLTIPCACVRPSAADEPMNLAPKRAGLGLQGCRVG